MRRTLNPGDKQAIIHAVSHESRRDVAQAQQVGDKSSEISVVRGLLKDTGVDAKKVSLDAHHCNPETMTQVDQKAQPTTFKGFDCSRADLAIPLTFDVILLIRNTLKTGFKSLAKLHRL
jgi:hypothetical protein